MNYFARKVLTLTALLSLFFMAAPAIAVASCANPTSPAESLNCGVDAGPGGCTGTCAAPQQSLDTLITNIVKILSAIVGLVAVLMIILGGFRYITSGGDTTKVNGAKNTIIYAVVGLVVVALAQAIVKFTLDKATTSTKSPAGSTVQQK